jgi:hypothetical protein
MHYGRHWEQDAEHFVVYFHRALQPITFDTNFVATTLLLTLLITTLLILQQKYMRLIRDEAASIRKAVQNLGFSALALAATPQTSGGAMEPLPSLTLNREGDK